MAVSPDGTRVYVTNEFDGTVSVIKVAPAQMNLVALQAVPADMDAVILTSPVSLVSDAAPTTAYNPAETSQSVDGVITGDLHAFDPLMFTGTQASEHGSVVVNRDGTFVYTPDADFVRIEQDTFSLEVEDGATYKLSGPVGLLQSALHRAAQVLGVSGSDTIDSHPTVKVIPKVIDTIDIGDAPFGVAVSPDGATVLRHQRIRGTVSVIDTATNTVTATIAVGDSPVGVAVSPDGATVYVTNAVDDTVSVIDTATNTVTATISVGYGPRFCGGQSRRQPPSTSPTPWTARCR